MHSGVVVQTSFILLINYGGILLCVGIAAKFFIKCNGSFVPHIRHSSPSQKTVASAQDARQNAAFLTKGQNDVLNSKLGKWWSLGESNP